MSRVFGRGGWRAKASILISLPSVIRVVYRSRRSAQRRNFVRKPAVRPSDRVVDRRRFIAGSAALLAAPHAAEAQQAGKVYQVGVVSLGARPTQQGMWQKVLEALRELNYVEGQNLVVRLAVAEGKPERLPALIAELMRVKVDVIVT